jgi:2-aminoadipate transaminase
MRLNFSGADEDEIREGVRRIGEVVREQVALYGTLTGVSQPPRRAAARPQPPERPGGPPADTPPTGSPAADPELAKILKLPAQRSRAG